MRIQTTRFGELNVPAECIIRFVSSLAGFPRHKRFALFPYEENSPFYILQSVSNAELMAIAAAACDGERWQRLPLRVYATAWHNE